MTYCFQSHLPIYTPSSKAWKYSLVYSLSNSCFFQTLNFLPSWQGSNFISLWLCFAFLWLLMKLSIFLYVYWLSAFSENNLLTGRAMMKEWLSGFFGFWRQHMPHLSMLLQKLFTEESIRLPALSDLEQEKALQLEASRKHLCHLAVKRQWIQLNLKCLWLTRYYVESVATHN